MLLEISGTLHEDQYTFLITSRSVLLRTRNASDKICRENRNTHFMFLNFFIFFRKPRCLWGNVEWHCAVGQATDDKMTHARCMLDTQGYKHTLRICNIYCFSKAIMLNERASLLHYTCIACIVNYFVNLNFFTYDVV
jgi:hypothetical protein